MPQDSSAFHLPHSHDPWLVALSIAMAVLAAYAALELAGRIPAARGRQRYLWLAGSATTLGIGIWSMHFIGMLGFRLPVAVQYDVLTTLASLLVAVAGSALALLLVSRPHLRGWQLGLGGLLQGGAIAGMHYLGMAAMRLKAVFGYEPGWFTASLLIAVAGACTALWLQDRFRAAVTPSERMWKAAGAGLLGVAIAGLHYAGMQAVVFLPAAAYPLSPAGSVSVNLLGAAALVIGAFTVVVIGLFASALDQRLGRLSIARKFLLVSVLFVAPLLIVIGLFSVELFDRIDRYGYRELYGVSYLRPLQSLLSHVQVHQETLADYLADRVPYEQLLAAQSAIESDLAVAAELDRRYGALLRTRERLAGVAAAWSDLQRQALQLTPAASRQRHAQLTGDLRALIAYVGDTSYLILDPDLDSYYLMDAALIRLPENQTRLDQSMDLLLSALASEAMVLDQRGQMIAALTLIRANVAALETNLEVAYRNDPAGFIEPNLAPAFAAYRRAINDYVRRLEEPLVRLTEPTITRAEAQQLASETRAAAASFYAVVSDNLAASIQGRIDRLTSRLVTLIGFSFFAGALAFTFGLAVFRSLVRPLRALTDAAQALAGGDLSVRVNVFGSDETGLLAMSFNDMARRLQAGQTELAERNRALATLLEVSRRLSTVLDEAQLVREVVEQIKAAFGYYHAHIYLFDGPRENLVLAGGTGPAGAALLARGHKLPRGKGLVGRAAETNAPVYAPHTARDPGWLPNPLLPETQAEIAVPLAVGGEVLGVLDVQHSVAGGLSPSDVETLQNIGNQTAVALRNARSYARAQRQAEREARLNAISRKIRSAVSLEAVLETAARELGQALQARAATAELNLRPVVERPPATGVAETAGQAGNGNSRS